MRATTGSMNFLLPAMLAHAAVQWLTPAFVFAENVQIALAPAAGIALACGGLWGWRALPGLVLGTWAARSFSFDMAATPMVAATVIQASVGVWRLHRVLGAGTYRLEGWRQIGRWLLVPALIAGCAGALPMTWAATAQSGTAAALWTWLVRVAGDVIGMVLLVPAVLALCAQPRADWIDRRRSLAVPLTLLAALLLVGLETASRWDLRQSRSNFEARARSAVARAEARLQAVVNTLDALYGAVLVAEDRPSIERFDAVAWSWLQSAPAAVEAGWLKRIDRMDAGGGLATALPEIDGRVVIARHVTSLAASSGESTDSRARSLLGVAEVQAALQATVRGGPARASDTYRLPDSPLDSTVVTLIRPYRLDRHDVVGWLFATFRVNALLEPAANEPSPSVALCASRDDTASAARRWVGGLPCESTAASSAWFEHIERVEIGGSMWTVVARQSAEEALRADGRWSVWLFAIAALPCAASFALLLVAVTGHAQREARRRAETERSAAISEQDLRSVFQTATVGLVQSGPDQLIVNANPAFCELTGYSLQELRRMRILDLTPAAEQPADEEAWMRLGAGGQDRVSRGRKHYRRRDGTLVPVSVMASAVRDAGGRLRCTVGSIQDISESLRLEQAEQVRQQAEAANQAKSTFVAHMSHELRTPLNAILGFAQLLAGSKAPNEPSAQEWLKRLQDAGWHLLAMINDLLDLSRIEGGLLLVQAADVELPALTDACLGMVREGAARRGIALHCVLAQDAQAVRADPVRLRQVLINLLSNAVKYNRDGGHVWLRSRRAATGFVDLEVTDSGMGMNAEQLDRLFQPFNRLGREHSTIEGTGIGLVIARHLAELMGGTLSVRSVVGSGSTFTLALPAADSFTPVHQRAAPATTTSPTRRVLYIEDNDTNAEIMRAMLARRPQVELRVAARADEGLKLLATYRPHLLLLDRHLPDMDGLMLLRRIRAADQNSGVPVLVVSSDAADAQIAEAIACGANDFLMKPLDFNALLAMVDRFLERVEFDS